jgi:Domain of unknown function (DUF4340)
MSTRTTWVLLAVLILVGIAVYFIEFRKPDAATATPVPSGPTTLLELSSPAINGITVRDTLSNTTVSATRDVSGTWWLISLAGQPGDPATLNSMASRLANVYIQRVLTPTGSLSEFGLVTPTLNVEIASTSGPLSFTVGDATPSKGAYYVQKTGDAHVYLIETGLVDELRRLASQPPVAVPPAATPAPFVVPTPASP